MKQINKTKRKYPKLKSTISKENVISGGELNNILKGLIDEKSGIYDYETILKDSILETYYQNSNNYFTRKVLDAYPVLLYNNEGLHLILQIILSDLITLYEDHFGNNHTEDITQDQIVAITNKYNIKKVQNSDTVQKSLNHIKNFLYKIIILLYEICDINSENGIVEDNVISLVNLENKIIQIIRKEFCDNESCNENEDVPRDIYVMIVYFSLVNVFAGFGIHFHIYIPSDIEILLHDAEKILDDISDGTHHKVLVLSKFILKNMFPKHLNDAISTSINENRKKVEQNYIRNRIKNEIIALVTSNDKCHVNNNDSYNKMKTNWDVCRSQISEYDLMYQITKDVCAVKSKVENNTHWTIKEQALNKCFLLELILTSEFYLDNQAFEKLCPTKIDDSYPQNALRQCVTGSLCLQSLEHNLKNILKPNSHNNANDNKLIETFFSFVGKGLHTVTSMVFDYGFIDRYLQKMGLSTTPKPNTKSTNSRWTNADKKHLRLDETFSDIKYFKYYIKNDNKQNIRCSYIYNEQYYIENEKGFKETKTIQDDDAKSTKAQESNNVKKQETKKSVFSFLPKK